MSLRPAQLLWVIASAIIIAAPGCGGDETSGGGGTGASTSGTGGTGGTGGSASGTGGSGGSTSGCDLDSATPPWPDWVPPWPGEGLNATGNTTFWAFDSGASIADLAVSNGATSAVVMWTTPGEADSTIGWGTEVDSCPTGYHRTGGRKEHRLAVGPLQPDTEYFVTVRSSDGTETDQDTINFSTSVEAPATELSDCATIDTPGDYRLVADVTADCTCMTVQADGVSLDLGWHTITYADVGTGEQCHGVAIDGSNAEVFNGIVEQSSNGGGALYSHAVRIYGGDHIAVDQLWLRVVGSDAFGLRSMVSDDVLVNHVLVVSEVQDVTDRHYPGNRGIALDLPDEGPGEVMDCILFGVPHWGIYMTGGDRLDTAPTSGQTRRIGNNHVFADMHATNGYGLGVHANHVEVDHNEVRPLTNGRALHYTRSNGHIHHNLIEAVELIAGEVSQGYAYYSDLADSASPHDASVCSWVVAHGIRVESGNFGVVHHNEVYTFSLADVSFGATSLNISTGSGAQGGIEVHHNQFTVHEATGSIACGGGLPIVAGWIRGEAPVLPADLHENRFVSNGDTLVIESPALATSTNDEEIQQ